VERPRRKVRFARLVLGGATVSTVGSSDDLHNGEGRPPTAGQLLGKIARLRCRAHATFLAAGGHPSTALASESEPDPRADAATAEATSTAPVDRRRRRSSRRWRSILSRPAGSRRVGARLHEKVLGRLLDRLAEARWLLEQLDPNEADERLIDLDACLNETTQLLKRHQPRPRFQLESWESAAWEHVVELECALVEIGEPAHLCAQLDEELARSDHQGTDEAAFVSETELLRQLRRTLADRGTTKSQTPEQKRAIVVLTKRYRARNHQQRHARTREARKRQLMWSVAIQLPVVVLLLLLLVIQTRDCSSDGCGPGDVWLAVFAGMLGAGISGLRRLRDEFLRLADMEAFPPAYLGQLVIGAGFGLVALLLTDVGVLPVLPKAAAAPSASVAVYAFLAGFSEPFVIGAIGRLAGARS
jgi:hypothetical protein